MGGRAAEEGGAAEVLGGMVTPSRAMLLLALMLGGTLIIDRQGEVVYQFKETSTFDNGKAQDLLDACRGKVPATPSQAEACE